MFFALRSLSLPSKWIAAWGLGLLLITGCGQPEGTPLNVKPANVMPADVAQDVVTSDPLRVAATEDRDTTSIALFETLMDEARDGAWHTKEMGALISQVGTWFHGKPYVAGTLDETPFEHLVIKLDGFDCVTFVESALALSHAIRSQSYSFTQFEDILRSLRYRDGVLDGYCSRLHYFTEWILNNEKHGYVEDISQAIGGVLLDKQINFMSEHRGSYAQLASDSLFAGIVAIEAALKEHPIYYIPQDKIRGVYSKLRAGDVIALATDIGGLDVAHTGFVYKNQDGSTGLLHASTTKGVVVSPDLQAYVENNKRQIGIVVARPLEMTNFE